MTELEYNARKAALEFVLNYPALDERGTLFDRAEKYRRFLMGEPVETPKCLGSIQSDARS